MTTTTLTAGSDLLWTLAHITNRDHAGRHFTETVSDADLDALEAAGLIAIERPVHHTGIPYGQEHWTLEVTEAGQDAVDSLYDERDYADREAR
jgi:hypothetical protein